MSKWSRFKRFLEDTCNLMIESMGVRLEWYFLKSLLHSGRRLDEGRIEVMICNDIQAFIPRSNENSHRYRNVTILDSNLTRSERLNATRCRSIRRDYARAITEFRGHPAPGRFNSLLFTGSSRCVQYIGTRGTRTCLGTRWISPRWILDWNIIWNILSPHKSSHFYYSCNIR